MYWQRLICKSSAFILFCSATFRQKSFDPVLRHLSEPVELNLRVFARNPSSKTKKTWSMTKKHHQIIYWKFILYRKNLFFPNIHKLYMNRFDIKRRFRIWNFFRKIFTPWGPRPGFLKTVFWGLGLLAEKIFKIWLQIRIQDSLVCGDSFWSKFYASVKFWKMHLHHQALILGMFELLN